MDVRGTAVVIFDFLYSPAPMRVACDKIELRRKPIVRKLGAGFALLFTLVHSVSNIFHIGCDIMPSLQTEQLAECDQFNSIF